MTKIDEQAQDDETRLFFVDANTLSDGDNKLPVDMLDGDLVIATQSGRCYERESNGTALSERYRFNAPVPPSLLILKANNTASRTKLLGYDTDNTFFWTKVTYKMLSTDNIPSNSDVLGYRVIDLPGGVQQLTSHWYTPTESTVAKTTAKLGLSGRDTSETTLVPTVSGETGETTDTPSVTIANGRRGQRFSERLIHGYHDDAVGDDCQRGEASDSVSGSSTGTTTTPSVTIANAGEASDSVRAHPRVPRRRRR